jgi:Icc-related predicted phosphoesterase
MTRIRIAAVSDLHGFLPEPDSLAGCDLLIVAGDICPIQDHSPSYQREWLERNFAPWLQAVSLPVVGCAGNHDIIFAPETRRSVPCLSWLYLQDEETELCGLRLYGTPWVPYLRAGWVFQAPETLGDDFLAERFLTIPEGLDILISHGPPYGVQDTTGVPRAGVDPHAGSQALANAIERTGPRLLVCGHVHGARGVSQIAVDGRTTTVANVCAVDRGYPPMWAPMVLDLAPESGSVEVVRS